MSKKGIAIALASILGVSALIGGAYAISRINGNDWFRKPTGNITISTNNNTTALQFEELNKKLNSYMAQVEVLESEKALLQKQYEEKEIAYNELLADATATTEALVNARKELVQLTLDLEAKQAEVDEQKVLIDELNAEIVALQTAYDELQELYSNALLEESIFEQMLNGTLTSLRMPDNVTRLDGYMLASSTITDLDLNNVGTLGNGALRNLIALKTIDLKNVEFIEGYLFSNHGNDTASNIEEIYGENIVSIDSDAFRLCKNLKLLDFSKCGTINISTNSFYLPNQTGTSNMLIIKLPNIKSTSTYNQNRFGLYAKYVEIGNFTPTSRQIIIGLSANLQNLNLTGDSVMPFSFMSFNSSLDMTSISIYVPDELLESYKTAEGWVDYADQIKPVSEMPEGIDTLEYYQTA